MLSNDQVRYVKTAFCKQKSKTIEHFHYQIFHIFQTIHIQYGTFIHRAGGGRVLSRFFKPPTTSKSKKPSSAPLPQRGKILKFPNLPHILPKITVGMNELLCNWKMRAPRSHCFSSHMSSGHLVKNQNPGGGFGATTS